MAFPEGTPKDPYIETQYAPRSPIVDSEDALAEKQSISTAIEDFKLRILTAYNTDPNRADYLRFPDRPGSYRLQDDGVWRIIMQSEATPDPNTVSISFGSVFGDPFVFHQNTLDNSSKTTRLDAIDKIRGFLDSHYPALESTPSDQ